MRHDWGSCGSTHLARDLEAACTSYLRLLLGDSYLGLLAWQGSTTAIFTKLLYPLLSFHLSAGVSKSQGVKYTVPRCGLLSLKWGWGRGMKKKDSDLQTVSISEFAKVSLKDIECRYSKVP